MRNTFLLLIFLCVGCAGAIAQNKTLGVGTATPNPNAVLHVESPTNNQGFIMPRMTTALRTAPAFISALSAADKGLMVYDTDLMGVYVWEGAQWSDESVSATISSTTGYAGYFAINNPSHSGSALYATTNGSGGSTSAAIEAVTATAFSAITARATGGAANALSGISSDPGAGSYAVLGTVSPGGGGQAGVFNIANATNPNNTLEATTIGTGGAAKFKVTNAASVLPALWAETNSNQPLSAPIFGLNTGTGDVAGSFKIGNAANTFPALYAETSGTGRGLFIRKTNTGGSQPGLFVQTDGGRGIWADHNGATGNAGIFQNLNAANSAAALFAEAVGAGPSIWANKMDAEPGPSFEATNSSTAGGSAGSFIINNPSSTNSVLDVTTNGSGPGIMAENTGTGNGFAALFQTTQATNTYPAVQATSKGSGSAIRAFQGATDGTGPGVDVFMQNTSSLAAGVRVDQKGNGEAGLFVVDSPAGTNSTIRALTNGNGTVILANHTGSSGNIAIFQNNNSNVARIDKSGQGFFNGGTVSSGADVAEMFDIEGIRNEYEPGDVLIISENTDRTVEKSNTPNSTKVAGVYATKPGVLLTEKSIEENLDALVPMGVVGVIPTKVCLENGPIKRGDLLVTSSTKGHAMKAVPVVINGVEIYPTGAILGKALENFESGEKGLIKVLVNVK